MRVSKPKTLSELRAYATSEDKIGNYFLELDSILSKYNLRSKPEAIYYRDEKGITLSQSPPYVVGSSQLTPIEICPEKSSTVTLIGCGNALGNQIPPYFIFQGARMREELLHGALPGTGGTVSESGWSNSEIFELYLKDHFLKYAKGAHDGKILLLYDGHRSHISPRLIEWAVAHDIILFVLPPHTSHVLQPMDVGCFGPFSKIFKGECHKWQRLNGGVVTRYNTCSLACKAYTLALSPGNLRSSFQKCGIYPFNPSAIDVSYLRPSRFAKSTETEVNSKQTRADTSAAESEDIISPASTGECGTPKTSSAFFAARLPVIQKKTPSQRRSVHKIVGGKAMTERDVSAGVSDYMENSQRPKKQKKECKKRKSSDRKNANVSGKQKERKNSKANLAPRLRSPQPGPSGIDTLLVSDDDISGGSDSEIQDEEKCCQCRRFQPLALRNCVSLVFTKWGQRMYEGCQHWVHLQYCCNVTVLRRHDTFYCPCHGVPCKPEE